jgi:hypothetical protein
MGRLLRGRAPVLTALDEGWRASMVVVFVVLFGGFGSEFGTVFLSGRMYSAVRCLLGEEKD